MARSAALQSLSDLCSRHITAHEVLFMQRFCDLRRHPWLTWFFIALTRLGDGPLYVLSALLFLAFGVERTRWAVAVAAVAVGVSIFIFGLIKTLIGRPRPFESWIDLPCLLAPPDKFSFPSGHTMTAFAVYAVYAEMIPGSGAVFLPVATLIGISRVFLGCHYPTDVLTGGFLGLIIGKGTEHVGSFLIFLAVP